MERWLSKPRVMLVLGVVMLSATLNRRDPLVYGLFLFLFSLGALGWALPWASLRRMAVSATGRGELVEGETSGLSLLIEQRGWWPVFMVEVHTSWEWAGRQVVLRHVVPVLRRGRPQQLGGCMLFECRGHYRLREIRLGCSFPLGLLEAQRVHGGFDVAFVVLPRATSVDLTGNMPVSADDRGLQITRRLGLSHELGGLRDYAFGEPVRRIHWRASARVGHLIVQQHLQSGSPMLRVVVQIPDVDQVGKAHSPDEQAIRTAAGLCRQAMANGARVRAYVTADAFATHINDIERALAMAAPGRLPLRPTLDRAAADLHDGDLLVVVVPVTCRPQILVPALVHVGSARVRVCIAGGPPHAASRSDIDRTLPEALDSAGIMHWPCEP